MGNDWARCSRWGFVRTIVHWSGVDAAIGPRVVRATTGDSYVGKAGIACTLIWMILSYCCSDLWPNIVCVRCVIWSRCRPYAPVRCNFSSSSRDLLTWITLYFLHTIVWSDRFNLLFWFWNRIIVRLIIFSSQHVSARSEKRKQSELVFSAILPHAFRNNYKQKVKIDRDSRTVNCASEKGMGREFKRVYGAEHRTSLYIQFFLTSVRSFYLFRVRSCVVEV